MNFFNNFSLNFDNGLHNHIVYNSNYMILVILKFTIFCTLLCRSLAATSKRLLFLKEKVEQGL